jgi:hypothetical protein
LTAALRSWRPIAIDEPARLAFYEAQSRSRKSHAAQMHHAGAPERQIHHNGTL